MVVGVAENRRRRVVRAIAMALGIVVGLSAVTLLAVYKWDFRALVGRSDNVVAFERIDTHGLLRPVPGLRVIWDGANWSAFWYGYLNTLDPRPAPPAVDFANYTVIVISQGMRPTGGYGLTVTAVYHQGAGLLVEAQERDPGSGCFVTQVLTWLYEVVKVPKTTGPVSVLLHWDSVPCP